MDELTGKQVTRLMRQQRQTIARLAKSMQITQVRVREVRRNGVRGPGYVMDWLQAITGNPNYVLIPVSVRRHVRRKAKDTA
jgi:hypothetical protein